jgi:hypothetical protein
LLSRGGLGHLSKPGRTRLQVGVDGTSMKRIGCAAAGNMSRSSPSNQGVPKVAAGTASNGLSEYTSP